jgi:type I restriction enzyme, S subunit
MTPEGWREARLGDLLDGIDAGWSPQCEGHPANPGAWGVLKLSAVTSGTYLELENKALPESLSPRPDLEVRPGDLLLARANGVIDLVGRTAIVRQTRQQLMISDKILRLRSRPGVAAGDFLHALLGFPSVREALTNVTGGSHMRNISQTSLRELLLEVPPFTEQRKIASILSSVDEAIEATQAVIDQLQVVKKATMAELLTRGLPGKHTRFKPSGIGMIPEEWEVLPLSELAFVQTGIAKGKAVEKGVELPYLRVANVQDGQVDLSEMKTILVEQRSVERYSLKSGDVLFTEGGDADKLGRGCVWRGQIDPCLHQNHVFAVRPDGARLQPEYLAYLAASPGGKAYFLDSAKQTTNLASINSTQLKAFPVPLASLEEQAQIVRMLAEVEGRTASEAACATQLRALKAALMSVLLTGEVRVKPDEEAA